MKKQLKRIMRGVTIGLITISLLLSLVPITIFADGDETVISTVNEFLDFASKCNLDSRFVGKTVRLAADINLSGTDFGGIPTFGGTFDGNGHTILGLSLSGQGDRYGLFRYLQKGAVVQNLNVTGVFDYSGSQSELGGIVGHNDGTVRFCTFSGTVRGKNTVGGVVGKNTENGSVISCRSGGVVIGEDSVGGIVGVNNGLISGCENRSLVNTSDEEYDFDAVGIDSDIQSTVENWMMAYRNDEKIVSGGVTDAGGIVGYSNGVLQGCKNYGNVGYAHIGYNVGGICGRQSGYMLGCENYGTINGRKDVGGIVGQAEPDVILSISGTSLETFRDEMNSLNDLVSDIIDHADTSADDLGTRLQNISNYTKSASDEAQNMLDSVSDALDDTKEFANENIKEINTKMAILSDAVDRLIPVLDGFEEIGDELTAAIDGMTDAVNCIDIERPDTDKTVSDITEGMRKAADGMTYLKEALEDTRKAAEDLDDAFDSMNWQKINASIKDLSAALKKFSDSLQKISESLNTIQDTVSGIGSPDEIPEALQTVLTQLGILAGAAGDGGKSLQDAAAAIALFMDGVYIDYDALGSASDNLQGALNQFKLSCDRIESSLKLLADGLEEGHIVLSDWFDDVKEQWEEFSDKITDASEHLDKAIDLLSDSASDISDILKTISEGGPLHMTELDADYTIDNTALFDSINGMGDEMDALRDNSLAEKDKFTDEINAVLDQFDKIMNLFMDETQALIDRSEDGELFVDVSEEDIERTKQGKIALSNNYSEVIGDRNVGGIVGSMAIEYSEDPEDDLEKPGTLNFTYNTKAVLQECRNEGIVTAKKDYVGGVVGNMGLGTVYECESYADITSTDGHYVGGIAGYSDTSIRKCYAKGILSGLRNVGGIAGSAHSVSDCYTIVLLDADETLGAIVGADCDKEGIQNNYFLDKGVGAIDSISYEGHAQPITYDELCTLNESAPERFMRFRITFEADGKTVSTLDTDYDMPVKDLTIPTIPVKIGYYAAWESFPEDTVTADTHIEAVYTPWVVAVESEMKNEKGLAVALVEGKFSDGASLQIETLPDPEIEGKRVLSPEYVLTLSGDNGNNANGVTIRLLNESGRDVEVMTWDGETWKVIPSETRGQYVCFTMNSESVHVCLVKSEKAVVRTIILCGIGAVVLVLLLVLLIKKKKAKMVKKKSAADSKPTRDN